MVCTACTNSYIAAKRGHTECVYHCARIHGWHPNTVVGAIEGGSRAMYERISDKRHVAPQLVNEAKAAAMHGWDDVVRVALPLMNHVDILKLAMETLGRGHTRLCEILCRDYRAGQSFRIPGFLRAIHSGKVDTCLWAEYFWKYTEDDWRTHVDKMRLEAIHSNSLEMVEYIFERFGMPRDPNKCLRNVVANADNYYMFRYLWDKVEDKSIVEDTLKNYCIEKNRIEVLRTIQKSVPTWPETFLDIARRGRQSALRKYLIKYAENCGAQEINVLRKRALHEMMEIIDDVEMPEGRYIKVCRLMRDLHTEL